MLEFLFPKWDKQLQDLTLATTLTTAQSGNLKDLSTSFYRPTHDVTRVPFGDADHLFLLNQVHPLLRKLFT